MASDKMNWGVFEKALAAHDEAIQESDSFNFWNPPDGVYTCVIVGKSATIFTDDKTGKSVLGFSVTYRVCDEQEFHGREFRSQSYRFNEVGLPWTKGFVQALHGDTTAPENSADLLASINDAVDREFQVVVNITNTTYKKRDGSSGSQCRDRILESGGATIGVAPEVPTGPEPDEPYSYAEPEAEPVSEEAEPQAVD